MNINDYLTTGIKGIATGTLLTVVSAFGAHADQASPLATGRWVKIAVKETGIHQITFEQLRQWGFDNPEDVTIYGYGGAAFWKCWSNPNDPGYIPQQYSIVNGDRILFYGEGSYRPAFFYQTVVSDTPAVQNERNNASEFGYYLITDSQPRQEVTSLPHNPLSTTIDSMHDCINIFEDEATFPSGMGQHIFGKDFSATDDKSVTYTCPIPDSAAGNPTINITNVVVGSGSNIRFRTTYPSVTSSSGTSSIIISLNMTVGTADLSYSTNYLSSSSIRQLTVPSGATEFDFKITVEPTANVTYGANDYFGYSYRRKNNFKGPQMTAWFRNLNDYRRIRFEGVNPNVVVWNIENPFKVQPFEVVRTADSMGNLTRLTFANHRTFSLSTSDTGGRVILFDTTAEQYPVEYAGQVENLDLRSVATPDMLIVTSGLCAPQAERLAQLHRDYLGHNVLVVTPEQVYNEFSSGTPAVNAVREFVKYLKNRPESPLKHVLLFGATSNDMVGVTPNSKALLREDNMVLSYPTYDRERQSSNIKGFTSDIYYGITDPNCLSEEVFIKTAASVNVGRLPAQNLLQATEAVDKIERYLTEHPTVDAVNRAVLLSEHGDSHSHLRNSEKVVTEFNTFDPATTTIKVYASFYPRGTTSAPTATNALKQALSMGVGYFNFSGHGKPDSFTRLNIWNLTDINSTPYNIMPVAMFATCDSYMFDQLSSSITERMVMMPNGGAIAGIGACRTVYEQRNQSLNQAVSREYGRSTDGTTTGDLFRLAVNNLAVNNPTITDLLVNDRCYNLCGDPGLPMYTAAHDRVFISSIDGGAAAKYNLTPLEPHTIEGFVTDAQGNVDETFDGSAILTLYEAPRLVNTTDVSTDVVSIQLDEDQLVSVKVPIANGRFTATVTTPMPLRSQLETYPYNRMTMLAVSSNNLVRRKGFTRAITITNEYPENIVDSTDPVIEEMYIDSPDFADGDAVSETVTIYARVAADASGLKLTTGGIGGSSKIVIDNQRIVKVNGSSLSANEDGSYEIAVPVTDLTDGPHFATLYVTDNAGNTGTRSVNFVVINRPAVATLNVIERPARVQATLELGHTFTGSPAGRLVIEDAHGNTIFTRDGVTFPYEWDLTDGEELVPDGIYRAYVIIKSGLQYGSTPKTEITVVQKQ